MLYLLNKTEQTSGRCVDIGESIFLFFEKQIVFRTTIIYRDFLSLILGG